MLPSQQRTRHIKFLKTIRVSLDPDPLTHLIPHQFESGSETISNVGPTLRHTSQENMKILQKQQANPANSMLYVLSCLS
jgi:hypothetical protein